jgi:hypothetical protein
MKEMFCYEHPWIINIVQEDKYLLEAKEYGRERERERERETHTNIGS